MFFWEGFKRIVPRRLTLFVEPIITVAVIARLHFESGWPRELIATQSPNWAFDLLAYHPLDLINEHIACEVKKTDKELQHMISVMIRHGNECTPNETKVQKIEVNGFNKLIGLRSRRAPIFWAAGPNGISYVFKVFYQSDGRIELLPSSNDALNFPG